MSKIDETFAKVAHDSGSKRIQIEDLPAEIQSAINYNPEKDKEARLKNQSAAKVAAERAELLKASFLARAKVQTVTPDGLIVTNMVQYLDPRQTSRESLFIQTPTKEKGYLSDGFYYLRVAPIGTYEYTTVTGTKRTIRKVILLEDLTSKTNSTKAKK